MFNIQVLDNISPAGLELFDTDFYQVSKEISEPDVILVRSFKLHDTPFSNSLKAVARAGAGTDNIPVDKLSAMGVPVFYAPGANANAVKELVMAAMLMGARHLHETRAFITDLNKENNQILNKEIESQKKQFIGHEIAGKTLGVIGLGNIGVKVANAALGLGMNVLAFDSNITINNALALNPQVNTVMDMNIVLAKADIITLHVPLNANTQNLIHEKNIVLMQPHALLLNFSREPIVNEAAILHQLNNHKVMGYITDFPTVHLANHPKVLSFPHLGASTQEAELGSAEMVIRNVRNFLEYGCIEHAINFPNISLTPLQIANSHRLLLINHNIPGAMGAITQKISQLGWNIEQMENKSRGDIAVNLIDISGKLDSHAEITSQFRDIESFVRLRMIS